MSAGAQYGRPFSAWSAHARTWTQDSVRACHGSFLPAAFGPHMLEHSSISSTVTVGNDVIADGVSLLKVGSRILRTY